MMDRSKKSSSKVMPILDNRNRRSSSKTSSKSFKSNIIKDEEFHNVQVKGDSVHITYKPPKKEKKEPQTIVDKILKSVLPRSAKKILGYDVWDLDKKLIIIICVVFYAFAIGSGAAVGLTQYNADVAQKFISLNENSGLCYEVPRGLNSEYMADDVGYWSTNNKFKYQKALYAASVKSLQMTGAEWQLAMNAVIKRLQTMTTKGRFRDFGWNMVLLGSFSTTVQAPDRWDSILKRNQPGGSLQFYANADSDILFGERNLVSINFANKNGICAFSNKGRFDFGSKEFIIQRQVCASGNCQYEEKDYCVDPDNKSSMKKKDILYPSQFGYIFGKTEGDSFEIEIDSRTLTTALAVNLGMISISDLQEIGKDDELESFKKVLVTKKAISATESLNLRAFYDALYAPMSPVYCMIYPNALPKQTQIFAGVTDDDARFASPLDLVSDDQIPKPTQSPTYQPTSIPIKPGNPTPKPTSLPTTALKVDFILAFGMVYAPLNVSTIYASSACLGKPKSDCYINLQAQPPCVEFLYLNNSIRSYLGNAREILEFGLFDLYGFDIQTRRLDLKNRKLAWGTTTAKPTVAPSPRPAPTPPIPAVDFGVYVKYKFDADNVQDQVDNILTKMYDNFAKPPAATTTFFKNAKVQPERFSFLGYFDPKTVESDVDDYSSSNYGYYSSIDDAGQTDDDAQTGEGNIRTRKLQSRLKEINYFKSNKLYGTDASIADFDFKRELGGETSTKPAKIDKQTGASCYIKVDSTFMYPMVSDYGVGGTSMPPEGFDFNNFLGKGDKQQVRLDGSLFSKFPLECKQDKVRSLKEGERIQYNDCQKFHVNVAFVFYPGVSSKPGSTKDTLTNGKVFEFGREAFEAYIADPKNGDIATTKKAYNAMSAITYEARYGGIDTKGIFPSLNLTQWNKAFYDLCDGLCSMLVLELMSDNRLPSINKYQYKPNDSPAFNNILYREHALKALKESFPEPMAEKYWECQIQATDAINSAIGVASGSANLYGMIALTIISFVAIYLSMGDGKKQLQTVVRKKELEKYKAVVISRLQLQALNLIAKQLEKSVGKKSTELHQLYTNIKILDAESKGRVELSDNNSTKKAREALTGRFLGAMQIFKKDLGEGGGSENNDEESGNDSNDGDDDERGDDEDDDGGDDDEGGDDEDDEDDDNDDDEEEEDKNKNSQSKNRKNKKSTSSSKSKKSNSSSKSKKSNSSSKTKKSQSKKASSSKSPFEIIGSFKEQVEKAQEYTGNGFLGSFLNWTGKEGDEDDEDDQDEEEDEEEDQEEDEEEDEENKKTKKNEKASQSKSKKSSTSSKTKQSQLRKGSTSSKSPSSKSPSSKSPSSKSPVRNNSSSYR